MAADLHHHSLVYARAYEVAHTAAAQVVEDEPLVAPTAASATDAGWAVSRPPGLLLRNFDELMADLTLPGHAPQEGPSAGALPRLIEAAERIAGRSGEHQP